MKRKLKDELNHLRQVLLYGDQVIIAKCCFNDMIRLVILTPQVAYYYNNSANNMRVLTLTSIFVNNCEVLKIYGVSTENNDIINEVLAGAHEIDEKGVTIIENYEGPVDEVIDKLNDGEEESFDEEEKNTSDIMNKYNLV